MIARLRPVPFDLGPVHFVGIGGIGMSGIAEIMLKIGYSVQGSDAKASANTDRLEKLGARVFIGHDAGHIGDGVSAVVYSTAVKSTNPEMVVARERRIPLVRRAEMLAELKAIVDFVENIPFYGFAAVCLDHPEVQRLVASIDNRRLVTYGVNPQAMVRADNVEMKPDGCRFDVVVQGQGLAALDEPIRITGLHLPMAGWHNVANALAAIAVARELDVSDEAIRAGLAGFGGVRRRFTTTGIVGGVRIVDDYGHHPVEIAAVLKAARQVAEGRVIAVVQPHRFTRLESLMEEFSTCFSDADAVFVADVYAAGETPIEGIDKDALVEGIRRFGHRSVQALESVEALPGVIAAEARDGDLVVLLGAGDITQWAYALPGQMEGLG
jgi:UDP-N-acetylmuramate--alanine ligase